MLIFTAMKTIAKSGESKLIIKKSVFYGFAVHVESEAGFRRLLADMRAKFADATHVTYAYKIGGQVAASDAKEPSHSAGSQILAEIEKLGIDQTAVFVVRYFGGVKLGKAGLSQAYRDAASAALRAGTMGEKQLVTIVTLDAVTGAKVAKKVENMGAKVVFLEDEVEVQFIKPAAEVKQTLAFFNINNAKIEQKEVIVWQ